MNDNSKCKKSLKIISYCIYGIVAVLSIYLIAGSLICKFNGKKFFVFNKYSFEVVLTQSMEPTIKTGSLVIVEKCDISEVNANESGDVVCFKATEGNLKGNNILHRAVGTYYDENNELCLYTKGDNNPICDQEAENIGQVSKDNFYGKGIFVSYFSGAILSFLRNPINLIFIAVIIVVLIFVKKSIMNLIKLSKEQNKED